MSEKIIESANHPDTQFEQQKHAIPLGECASKKRNTRLKRKHAKECEAKEKEREKEQYKKKAASASSEVADLFIFDFFTTLTDKFFFLPFCMSIYMYFSYL